LCFFFDTVLRKDYFLRRGQLEDILNGRHHKVFVAEIDGILVGVAILTRGTRLLNALVHPAYRGLAIGKELVSQSGAREVRAKLDMSTGDPRGFYESLGFEPTDQFNTKGNIQLMRISSSRGKKRAAARGPAGRQALPAQRRANGNGRHSQARK